jgi:hypothetical protein
MSHNDSDLCGMFKSTTPEPSTVLPQDSFTSLRWTHPRGLILHPCVLVGLSAHTVGMELTSCPALLNSKSTKPHPSASLTAGWPCHMLQTKSSVRQWPLHFKLSHTLKVRISDHFFMTKENKKERNQLWKGRKSQTTLKCPGNLVAIFLSQIFRKWCFLMQTQLLCELLCFCFL